MAETLRMLCDKLTIVNPKQFHTEDADKLNSLDKQAKSNNCIDAKIKNLQPCDT